MLKFLPFSLQVNIYSPKLELNTFKHLLNTLGGILKDIRTLNLDTFEARVKRLRGNLTQDQFAKSVGIKQTLISDYETGRTKPTTEILEKISRKANVNLNWLITGEGDPYIETKEIVVREGNGSYGRSARFVPLYSGVGCGDYRTWESKAEKVLTPDRSVLFKVAAKGDSMKDFILDGDILDVVPLTARKNNQIVIVSFKTEPEEINATAKYIRWNYPDKDHVELRSRNYRYEPTIVSVNEIYNIYKVKSIYRKIK
jgi:transcriptional regulator with XRE-family HTH domain